MVPLSGFSLPMIILSRVVLPAPLGPIIPTIAAWGNGSRKSVENEAVVVGFRHLVKFKDNVTEARTRRDVDFQFFAALFGFLSEQFFVGSDTRLSLWIDAPWATCGSIRVRARESFGAGFRISLRGGCAPAFVRARRSSCPSRGCRSRGRVRGSSLRRYRGSSGRG